ncbi:MAG TPA: zinc ribbon domain-containing protein [Tissierellaceae bacterium]
MFFIFGITTKEDKLDFTQTFVCPNCGAYGRLEVFVTYTVFTLFFLPIFKWNKRYYVKSTCCGSLYSIDSDLGRDIEKGIKTKIEESDLRPIYTGYSQRYCPSCHYPIDPEFQFCPRCGSRL